MRASGNPPAAGLLLFDIDGTLLRRSGPQHRQALTEAVHRVTGVEVSTDGIPVQGMLDRDILTLMMRRAGVTLKQVQAWMPDIVAAAQSLYVRRCPDLRRKVCPGVRALLRKLDRHGVAAGLVTGNLSRIGWKKMERAGIKSHFRVGAFSEEARTRSALARLAIRRARRQGWLDRRVPVGLVGDHPNDIEAARANKITAIAVATGLSSAEELAAHSPDILLPNLREFRLQMWL